MIQSFVDRFQKSRFTQSRTINVHAFLHRFFTTSTSAIPLQHLIQTISNVYPRNSRKPTAIATAYKFMIIPMPLDSTQIARSHRGLDRKTLISSSHTARWGQLNKYRTKLVFLQLWPKTAQRKAKQSRSCHLHIWVLAVSRNSQCSYIPAYVISYD